MLIFGGDPVDITHKFDIQLVDIIERVVRTNVGVCEVVSLVLLEQGIRRFVVRLVAIFLG